MRGRLTILLAASLCSTSALAQVRAEAVVEPARGSDQVARRAPVPPEFQARRDQYMQMIESHVTRFWDRPLSARPGIECAVTIVQLPTGDVTSAKVGQCNGDDAERRSIENAVRKASPLPKPPSQAVFSSTFTLYFEPDK